MKSNIIKVKQIMVYLLLLSLIKGVNAKNEKVFDLCDSTSQTRMTNDTNSIGLLDSNVLQNRCIRYIFSPFSPVSLYL